MAINYEQVGWDTNKYVNPTRMNHMDDGIKKACDKADEHDQQIETINSNLDTTNNKFNSFMNRFSEIRCYNLRTFSNYTKIKLNFNDAYQILFIYGVSTGSCIVNATIFLTVGGEYEAKIITDNTNNFILLNGSKDGEINIICNNYANMQLFTSADCTITYS